MLIFVAIVVFITYVHQATRQIPIQHAKRVVGNRVFSTANTYLPLKVATAGVIPIIFAISVVMLPATISQFIKSHNMMIKIGHDTALGRLAGLSLAGPHIGWVQ